CEQLKTPMKKSSSSNRGFIHLRNLTVIFLCVCGASFAVLSFASSFPGSRATLSKSKPKSSVQTAKPATPSVPTAPTPASATLSPANPVINYTDGPLVTNTTGAVNGAPICAAPNTCSDFMLTINAHSVAATKEILIEGTWTPAQNDFDMYIEDTSGNVFAANSSTANPSAIILPVPADGTVWHIVIEASVGAGNLAGLVELIDIPTPVNQGPGIPPRYMNYPAGATQANGGEPSIGV